MQCSELDPNRTTFYTKFAINPQANEPKLQGMLGLSHRLWRDLYIGTELQVSTSLRTQDGLIRAGNSLNFHLRYRLFSCNLDVGFLAVLDFTHVQRNYQTGREESGHLSFKTGPTIEIILNKDASIGAAALLTLVEASRTPNPVFTGLLFFKWNFPELSRLPAHQSDPAPLALAPVKQLPEPPKKNPEAPIKQMPFVKRTPGSFLCEERQRDYTAEILGARHHLSTLALNDNAAVTMRSAYALLHSDDPKKWNEGLHLAGLLKPEDQLPEDPDCKFSAQVPPAPPPNCGSKPTENQALAWAFEGTSDPDILQKNLERVYRAPLTQIDLAQEVLRRAASKLSSSFSDATFRMQRQVQALFLEPVLDNSSDRDFIALYSSTWMKIIHESGAAYENLPIDPTQPNTFNRWVFHTIAKIHEWRVKYSEQDYFDRLIDAGLLDPSATSFANKKKFFLEHFDLKQKPPLKDPEVLEEIGQTLEDLSNQMQERQKLFNEQIQYLKSASLGISSAGVLAFYSNNPSKQREMAEKALAKLFDFTDLYQIDLADLSWDDPIDPRCTEQSKSTPPNPSQKPHNAVQAWVRMLADQRRQQEQEKRNRSFVDTTLSATQDSLVDDSIMLAAGAASSTTTPIILFAKAMKAANDFYNRQRAQQALMLAGKTTPEKYQKQRVGDTLRTGVTIAKSAITAIGSLRAAIARGAVVIGAKKTSGGILSIILRKVKDLGKNLGKDFSEEVVIQIAENTIYQLISGDNQSAKEPLLTYLWNILKEADVKTTAAESLAGQGVGLAHAAVKKGGKKAAERLPRNGNEFYLTGFKKDKQGRDIPQLATLEGSPNSPRRAAKTPSSSTPARDGSTDDHSHPMRIVPAPSSENPSQPPNGPRGTSRPPSHPLRTPVQVRIPPHSSLDSGDLFEAYFMDGAAPVTMRVVDTLPNGTLRARDPKGNIRTFTAQDLDNLHSGYKVVAYNTDGSITVENALGQTSNVSSEQLRELNKKKDHPPLIISKLKERALQYRLRHQDPKPSEVINPNTLQTMAGTSQPLGQYATRIGDSSTTRITPMSPTLEALTQIRTQYRQEHPGQTLPDNTPIAMTVTRLSSQRNGGARQDVLLYVGTPAAAQATLDPLLRDHTRTTRSPQVISMRIESNHVNGRPEISLQPTTAPLAPVLRTLQTQYPNGHIAFHVTSPQQLTDVTTTPVKNFRLTRAVPENPPILSPEFIISCRDKGLISAERANSIGRDLQDASRYSQRGLHHSVAWNDFVTALESQYQDDKNKMEQNPRPQVPQTPTEAMSATRSAHHSFPQNGSERLLDMIKRGEIQMNSGGLMVGGSLSEAQSS